MSAVFSAVEVKERAGTQRKPEVLLPTILWSRND